MKWTMYEWHGFAVALWIAIFSTGVLCALTLLEVNPTTLNVLAGAVSLYALVLVCNYLYLMIKGVAN